MKISLVKNADSTFSLLKEDGVELEKYSFDVTIDFKALMTFLIRNELADKITIAKEFETDSLTEQEVKLISLIEEIIKTYNQKVDELNNQIQQ